MFLLLIVSSPTPLVLFWSLMLLRLILFVYTSLLLIVGVVAVSGGVV
jgi:hypothetical protein